MKRIVLLVLLMLLAPTLFAANDYQPTPANLKAREWFQDAKFGLFVHWGIYSIRGRAEWVLYNDRIPVKNYETLAQFFNPTEFNPAEWVAVVKDAGMKYITITSKHHDGFAMFDSKVSDWDIADRTPYKKDVLKMLADECRKQGIKLFFYHSQLDWHHPDYFPLGRTGEGLGRAEQGDWQKYLEYQDSQLRELLTNYGEIGGIWFDGWWDKKNGDWKLDRTYKLIHDLQPQALVGNNHHQAPFPGEDFQMFEKDLPGRNTAGFNAESKIGNLPLETCETINGSWGYNLSDNRFKSTRELIHYLVKAAGNNANFLLNVGPMPNGKIQPEFTQRLKEIGAWLKVYGESIYGTRGGPISQRPWGVTTVKGNRLFVHILDWPDRMLVLPPLDRPLKGAKMLKGGAKVELRQDPAGAVLILPNPPAADEFDTVVELEL
ncbi:MAG: alpha-L-fucosidase [Acidobacteria bacterium]|nr:MAG: alpha-L-fucosidase [Acidobacteriota bacterium]